MSPEAARVQRLSASIDLAIDSREKALRAGVCAFRELHEIGL